MTYEVLDLGADPSDPVHDEQHASDLRRRRRIVAVLAALVVVTAGAFAIVRARNDPVVPPYVFVAPEAVTTTPSRAWTWTASDTVLTVTAAASTTYVMASDGQLTSLDRQGGVRWSVSLPGADYATALGHGDVVLAYGFGEDARNTYVVSATSGKRLWSVAGSSLGGGDDFLILEDDHNLWRADLATGDRRWHVDAGSDARATQDHVILRRDDRLMDLSTSDGSVVWTTKRKAPSDDDVLEVAIADGYTVVADDGGAEALDLDSGKVLWTTLPGADTTNIGLATSDQVFVIAEDPEEPEHETVGIYDRSGRVTTFESLDDAFFAQPVIAGEHRYLHDIVSGAVYDATAFKIVDKPDRAENAQPRALTDAGYYTLASGGVTFYRYGDSRPAWTLTGTFNEEDSTLIAGDRQLLVSQGATVSAYQ